MADCMNRRTVESTDRSDTHHSALFVLPTAAASTVAVKLGYFMARSGPAESFCDVHLKLCPSDP